jgi:hypothetical protein
MVTDFYLPGIVVGVGRYMVCKQKASHKSEMAGPFSRGGTIINKTFTITISGRGVSCLKYEKYKCGRNMFVYFLRSKWFLQKISETK